jgi:hypothetical protein
MRRRRIRQSNLVYVTVHGLSNRHPLPMTRSAIRIGAASLAERRGSANTATVARIARSGHMEQHEVPAALVKEFLSA